VSGKTGASGLFVLPLQFLRWLFVGAWSELGGGSSRDCHEGCLMEFPTAHGVIPLHKRRRVYASASQLLMSRHGVEVKSWRTIWSLER
jgi:hypothetical protein